MRKLFYFIFYFLFVQLSSSQDFKLFHNLDVSTPKYYFETDSSSFSVFQIPFMNLELNAYADPRLNIFLSKSENTYVLNLSALANSISDYSHHVLDISNSLVYYAIKKNNTINSFGINHNFFSEISLSNDIVSLMVNGNYHYLNQNINFGNTYLRALNYFSFYWGFDILLSNELVIGSKFKFLKGIGSMGLDLQNSNMLFSDNIATVDNPFSTNTNIDFHYLLNNNFSVFSNPGFALDLSVQYQLGSSTSLHVNTSDLGFILWQEDQYSYQGSFEYDGLNYDLDQDVITEFNNLFDSIVDVFETKENRNVSTLHLLPFDIDVGITYGSGVTSSRFIVNYNVKKLTQNLLHTGSVSYMFYLPDYKICLAPNYSFNKFNYLNFSFFLQKKWIDKLYTNIYVNNCIGFVSSSYRGRNIGLGMEFLLLF
tara:strand:- start:160 stop:1434 length:1275 start_codon:yes stop_codon:yes gene_type:complete